MKFFLEKFEQNKSPEYTNLRETPGRTWVYLSNKWSWAWDPKFEIIINDENKTNWWIDHKQSFTLTENQLKKLQKKPWFSWNQFNFVADWKNYTTYFVDTVDTNRWTTLYIPYVRMNQSKSNELVWKPIDIKVIGTWKAQYKNEKWEIVSIAWFTTDTYHYALDSDGNKLNGNISISQYRKFMWIEEESQTLSTSVEGGKAYNIINWVKTQVNIKAVETDLWIIYQWYDILGNVIPTCTFSASQYLDYIWNPNEKNYITTSIPVSVKWKWVALANIDWKEVPVTIKPKVTLLANNTTFTEYIAYHNNEEIKNSGVSVNSYNQYIWNDATSWDSGNWFSRIKFPEFKTDDISGLWFKNTKIEHAWGNLFIHIYTLDLPNDLQLQTSNWKDYYLYKITKTPITNSTSNDPYTYTFRLQSPKLNKQNAQRLIPANKSLTSVGK